MLEYYSLIKQDIMLRAHSHAVPYCIHIIADVFAIYNGGPTRWSVQACEYRPESKDTFSVLTEIHLKYADKIETEYSNPAYRHSSYSMEKL